MDKFFLPFLFSLLYSGFEEIDIVQCIICAWQMAIMVSVPSPYSCVRCGTYSCMALNVTNLVCCFDGKDGQMTEACYEYPSSNAIFHFPPFSFCFCSFPPSSSACVIMNQYWSNGMRVVFTTFEHRNHNR